MICSRISQEPDLEKKEFKKESKEEQKSVKKFQNYNFTPLNTREAKVFMERKKGSEFRWPPKISGNPPSHKKDKYCDLHKAAGHHTGGCIVLRLLIQKFIKNGKLVWVQWE